MGFVFNGLVVGVLAGLYKNMVRLSDYSHTIYCYVQLEETNKSVWKYHYMSMCKHVCLASRKVGKSINSSVYKCLKKLTFIYDH